MGLSKALEFWAWALIFGGILAASVGWFLLGASPVLGSGAITAGGIAVVAGVVLIYWRSRIKDSSS
jgi:hypothetical protein